MNSPSNLTLVTCLYDIGRGNLESGFKRDFSHYKDCFARLLAVKYPMVIFCEEDLNDFIWQHRTRDNTQIVNKSLHDLKTRYFPFYDKVQEIRAKPEWINQSGWIVDSTQAKLDMYAPLVMSKQFFLNDASLFNPFSTKYFMFIDAGISNTIGNPLEYLDDTFEQRITPHLENKMMYLAFPYQDDAPEVHGFTKPKLNELAGTVTQHVCRGGLFGGAKEAINDINDVYYHLLSSTLQAGYMGTEESIFTIISYLHKDKINVRMIEPNGLIFRFLQDLKDAPLPVVKQHPLAWYFLVFNTPKQFEFTLEKWKSAYPEEFKRVKKYVVNNSNDPTVDADYKRIFAENDMEEFKFDNIGICSGRQFVAEHFDASDHDYYVFIEEDMGVYEREKDPATCKNGLTTHHYGLFEKSVEIMKAEKLDVLRLTFTEFFGDCMVSWAYINFPRDRKNLYYPPKDGMIEAKEYSPIAINKVKVKHHGVYKGLPYAVGNYHVSNWPLMFNKEGNRKVYLDIKWEHIYEQTIMSNAGFLWEDGKLEVGCLLASPVLHNRIYHYDGSKRRENKHYTN
jgi:hypothetical protein